GGTVQLQQTPDPEFHLEITDDLTIEGDSDGDGLRDITIAAQFSRHFLLSDGALTLNNLTLTGGYGIYFDRFKGGGAVRALAGTDLEIKNSLLTDNQATVTGYGGTIASNGTVRVLGSEITGNEADFGGALHVSGEALYLSNTRISDNRDGYGGHTVITGDGTKLTIINSTIAENFSYEGGPLLAGGPTLISHSTITGNVSVYESGGTGLSGDATVVNSLILGNRVLTAEDSAEVTGSLVLQGNNIVGTKILAGGTEIGTTSAAEVFASGSILALAGPAVDFADPALLPQDEFDADGDGDLSEILAVDGAGDARIAGAAPDLGAAELQAPGTLQVTTLADEGFDGGNLAQESADGGGLSLREALAFTNATAQAEEIVFADGLTGDLVLTQGTLTVAGDLTLSGDTDGDDAADITLAAPIFDFTDAPQQRVGIEIQSGTAEISAIRAVGLQSPEPGGQVLPAGEAGAFFEVGPGAGLILRESEIADTDPSLAVGAIDALGATVAVYDSLIHRIEGAGAIRAQNTDLSLIGTTLT
ncbi:MAG: right-handed parallel beta-helix repeat-containing protein, partial [Pseudomonadota bacterium]